jgi:hypothetical protein
MMEYLMSKNKMLNKIHSHYDNVGGYETLNCSISDIPKDKILSITQVSGEKTIFLGALRNRCISSMTAQQFDKGRP